MRTRHYEHLGPVARESRPFHQVRLYLTAIAPPMPCTPTPPATPHLPPARPLGLGLPNLRSLSISCRGLLNGWRRPESVRTTCQPYPRPCASGSHANLTFQSTLRFTTGALGANFWLQE